MIPNLRGRLSFSTIGTSTKPYPFEKHNLEHVDIIFHNRTLNDSALPRFVRSILFTNSYFLIRYFFILIQFFYKSETLEKLLYHDGDFIFVYLLDKDNSTVDVLKGKTFVVNSTLTPKESFAPSLIGISTVSFEDACKVLQHVSSLYSTFTIKRNGILELKNFVLKKVENGSLRWVTKEQNCSYQKFKHDTFSQIYYFMKDLCHQHQHHDPKSDTLLPLIEADSSDYLKNMSDGILKSLYRTVLKMRRTHSEEEYYCMQGILMYAKSFRQIAQKIDPELKHPEGFTDLGDENILKSIDAKAGSLKAQKERKKHFISGIPSLMSLSVAFVGITLAFASIVIISGKASEDGTNLEHLKNALSTNSVSIAESILSNPLEILIYIGSILLLLWFLVSDYFRESKFVLDIKRIAYSFKHQRITAIFLGITGFIIIVSAIFILDLNILLSAIENFTSQLESISLSDIKDIVIKALST